MPETTFLSLPKKFLSLEKDFSFREDFQYNHQNPYHERLGKFQEFVLRDHEAEVFKGEWKGKIFNNEFPLHIEIGSGSGHFMRDFCLRNPQINFVGLDYRFKRSYQLAKMLSELPQKNFRYLRAKGERIEFLFGENEVDKVYYFFPDPWPKTRHHKKRLFQPVFIQGLFRILKAGGEVHIKTDHDEYFQWMENFLKNYENSQFEILLKTKDLKNEYPRHFLSSFETKFEKIFIKQGIKIKAFVLKSLKAF